MATLYEALAAYRICAQAEDKSPKTVRWITSSITYFINFLGPDRQDIDYHYKRKYNLANYITNAAIGGVSKALVSEMGQILATYSVHFEVPLDCYSLCVASENRMWTKLRKFSLSD